MAHLSTGSLPTPLDRLRPREQAAVDAACQLVEEALEPFEDDLWRCVDLGLNDAAKRQLLGLLDGLYRSRDPDAGSVLAYAGPDLPHEHATWLIDSAIEVGVDLDVDAVELRCPVLRPHLPVQD